MPRRAQQLDQYARPRLGDRGVRELVTRLGVDPDTANDLGGTMSLNVRVPEAGAVVRVHPPFATRARLVGLRALRRSLADAGLLVGEPLPLAGGELVRVGRSWAELESFIDHDKPPPTWASYTWMYEAMGRLHRHVAGERLPVPLPRPVVSTYGPPGSLRRWLAATEEAVAGDVEALEVASWARRLLPRLERQWMPAPQLPCQLVHGDIRLGNVAVARGPGGGAAYLDFGFAACRPRVHDLAYSLPWIVLRPDDSGRPEDFAWERVGELVEAYETGAGDRLRAEERAALAPYVAAVPLYLASVAAFTPDPAATLRGEIASLRIADWVLAHGIRW